MTAGGRAGRPNILLIVTDQERAWDTLPAGLRLPARERLRGQAINFTNYHVNAVACSPSRSTIYTGQHIQRTGVIDNVGGRMGLDPLRTPTLGQMLQARGYFTAYAGKWHLSAGASMRRRRADFSDALVPYGFDLYRPPTAEGDTYGGPHEGAVTDGSLAGWARRWLGRDAVDIAEAQPWFLALNFVNPHDIMFFDATGRQGASQLTDWAHMAPAPRGRLYGQDLGFDLPASFTADFSGRPAVHRAFAEDAALAYGELPYDDEAAWRAYQNYYFNCLRDVDRRLGAVLDALEESRAGQNTIVIFTSDHGELAGAHGLRGKGPVLYRENFGVPFVVRHPDVAGAGDSRALISSVDLAPTLLSFAGRGPAEAAAAGLDLVGYDMSASLTDPSGQGARAAKAGGVLLNSSLVHASNPASTRRSVLRQRQAAEPATKVAAPPKWPDDWFDPGLRSFLRGYYDGRYRFARYFEPCDDELPRDWESLVARNDLELYDTQADVAEMNNLAATPTVYRSLILELNAKLNGLIENEAKGESPDPPYKFLVPEEKERISVAQRCSASGADGSSC